MSKTITIELLESRAAALGLQVGFCLISPARESVCHEFATREDGDLLLTWNQSETNQIDGTGIATYPNGDVYEGNFTAGKRQGQGTMRYATGEVATGTWTDGALKEAAPVPAEGTATPPATTAPADN